MEPSEFEKRIRDVLHDADVNQYDAADVLEKLADEQRREGDDREEA